MRTCARLALFLSLVVSALATTIDVATLNCFLDFDPRLPHRGKVASEQPLSVDAYVTKTQNLGGLARPYAFVALQEVGGKAEVAALAAAAGKRWAFATGRDTATGEECGALFDLPGWRVSIDGRVAALDRALSKHLCVTATSPTGSVVKFLVVHLIRPIGNQASKHSAQLKAVGDWACAQVAAAGNVTVIILGDTNSELVQRGSSLFGIGSEAGEFVDFAATHLARKPYDRIVVAGQGKVISAGITAPPYGRRPTAAAKQVWTDHFLLAARIEVP